MTQTTGITQISVIYVRKQGSRDDRATRRECGPPSGARDPGAAGFMCCELSSCIYSRRARASGAGGRDRLVWRPMADTAGSVVDTSACAYPGLPSTIAAMSDSLPLAGRVAVVTGVSRRVGIGYAIAARLAGRGADVLAHSWAPHDAEQPWAPTHSAPAVSSTPYVPSCHPAPAGSPTTPPTSATRAPPPSSSTPRSPSSARWMCWSPITPAPAVTTWPPAPRRSWTGAGR
jgi:hypothetical protein